MPKYTTRLPDDMITKDDLAGMDRPDALIAGAGPSAPLLRLMRDRYSVRSFSDQPIEDEKLKAILTAGQLAPTAVNFQPQKVYVLQSPDARERINRLCRCIYGAPVVLMVCSDETLTWKSRTERGYSTGEMDCSIVCTHLMLEAWEQGIGSVWVRLFNAAEVARAFRLPQNIKPVCLLPIGYPANDSRPYAPWHNEFRGLSETTEIL